MVNGFGRTAVKIKGINKAQSSILPSFNIQID